MNIEKQKTKRGAALNLRHGHDGPRLSRQKVGERGSVAGRVENRPRPARAGSQVRTAAAWLRVASAIEGAEKTAHDAAVGVGVAASRQRLAQRLDKRGFGLEMPDAG